MVLRERVKQQAAASQACQVNSAGPQGVPGIKVCVS